MTAHQGLAEGDPRRIGRYRILARLGAGGMGKVFLARSPGGRLVAIKVVRAELADDPQFRQRFAREVAAARRVNSFFTAGVVDADPEGSPPWLATAYVAGVSLGEAITAHGPWAEPSVRALGAGLVEALETIHAAGVVHRDLKPSNVLLAPDGPRVIDFGISLAAEDTALTQTGSAVGTPGFMSPEQLTGASVGPASDVFALGAVLGYAGTGAGPFGTGSAHGVNFRAVYEPPHLDGLTPALHTLVSRCLAKEPERRPSVAELLDLLAERDEAVDGASATPALTAADWLPTPVATAVRERTETALPTSPPPSHPPEPPVQDASRPTAAPADPPADQPPPHAPTVAEPSASTELDPPPADAPPADRPPAGAAPGDHPADRTTVDAPAVRPPSAEPRVQLGPKPPRPDYSRRRLLTGMGGAFAAVAATGLVAWIARDDSGGKGAADPDGKGDTRGANGGTSGGAPKPRTVRIAFQGPLSGGLESIGTGMLAAVQLAVDDARKAGEHPDLRFEVLEANDAGNEGIGAAAEKVVEDRDVLAVVGPAFAEDLSAEPYDAARLAVVFPSSGEPDLTRKHATFLAAVPDDTQVGRAIGRFLDHQGAGTVMLVDDDTEYGQRLAEAVRGTLRDASVTVKRDSVRENVADGAAHAGKVVAAGADAVVYCGYWPKAGPLSAALVDVGWEGIRVGGDKIKGGKFLDDAGPSGNGWYVVCPCYDVSGSAAGRDFAQRYRAETGREPGDQAPRTYDITAMIIQAVTEVGAKADRASVLQRLSGSRYQGLTGVISFDSEGGYTGSGPELFRAAGGAFEPLGPAEDYRARVGHRPSGTALR